MISFHQEYAAPIPSALPSPEGTVVARMAQVMIERADQGIDERTLTLAGFTRAEITAHSAEAIDLANLSGRAG
ncbi:hypothetical protein WHT83_14835 [Aminobacter sp. P9b]|uniref:hypothetical protein n=1 Tax=Aminobacter sp. P9b TaxID=3133697 RepID=UPI0032472207